MFGCLSCAETWASRLKRSTSSSRLAPAAARPSSRMVLIATMRPRILSLALKTVPNAPAPSFLTTWYRPAISLGSEAAGLVSVTSYLSAGRPAQHAASDEVEMDVIDAVPGVG